MVITNSEARNLIKDLTFENKKNAETVFIPKMPLESELSPILTAGLLMA